MSNKPYLMVCAASTAHGYWPLTHHRFALSLAEGDQPQNPKFQRMLDGLCLICGAKNLRAVWQ